ncbi:hypothetical protein AXX17_AT4G06650 [Arabidopsis thaliana]|uniref:Uncharacterized protein n=1 Tax=Arabidopsis thaliana TaxID=3702 RepID=A0A178UVD5_ARATH|nr:hypothetical protein AXX17_AT4G06650 [Arabidopsis thaliana]
MDRSTFPPSSSVPGNQTPSSPMPPSPITSWSRHYLSRSNRDVRFPFYRRIPQGAVEPTYVWNRLTVDGDGPSFQPEGRDFVSGSVLFPEDFMSSASQQDCEQLLHWHDLLQDMERGMRRLLAHSKDWVSCTLESESPKTIGTDAEVVPDEEK